MITRAWRRLGFEQRVAAVGAVLLVVSTLGRAFSLVELAVVLVGASVLWLLKQRAEGRDFHLPFGDGTVIMAAGLWAGLLIAVRLFDRPLGQSVLALGCAAILAGAGARERARRPADDVPRPRRPRADAVEVAPRESAAASSEAPTARLDEDGVATVRLGEEPETHLDEEPGARRRARNEERPRRE